MATKKKNTLNLKILLVILYIFTIVIVDSLFTLRIGDQGDEKLKWVSHTNNVIIETKEYLGALKDAETGQRGYILTSNSNYLKPYYSGLEQAKISFLKLSNLTSDNQKQVNRLKLINKLMQLKFKELKETIETKNNADAIMIIKNNTGKKHMDEMRSMLSKFTNEEVILLDKRKKELSDIILKNLFIVRVISSLLLLVLFYFIYLNFKQKREIQRINENLELKIEEEIQKNSDKDKQLLSQSRLAAMGEMIGMIAHQWRQPIASIGMDANNMLLDIALENFSTTEAEKYAKSITSQTQHLSSTIDDFRNFFKPDKGISQVNIKEIINSTLAIVKDSLKNSNIELITSYETEKEIKAYPRELMQVFVNIINNSKDVLTLNTPDNASITIKTYEDEKYITTEISDNGGGIDVDVLPKVFDPYFSTKDEKTGTGLGLYMSKIIIEKHHNGKLSVRNIDNGVCFIIQLEIISEKQKL